jgi:HlyD family secretion protein
LSEETNIELRSEEVQEILGQVPNKIIRYGITVLFIIVLSLITGSFFFKYPDIIYAPLSVTTQNPPEYVKSKISGKIDTLFVSDKQKVNNETYLAIIENSANFNDFITLKEFIQNSEAFFIDLDSANLLLPEKSLQLGEIQTYYSDLIKQIDEYFTFIKLNFHNKKISSFEKQKIQTQKYYKSLCTQVEILESEFDVQTEKYERATEIFNAGATSKSEFSDAESVYLQKKYSIENSKNSLINTEIEISQLEQNILDLQLEYYQQLSTFKTNLTQSFDLLKNQAEAWEQTYLLKSSIDGIVTFTNIWNQNQNIDANQIVFTVVPETETEIIAYLELPIEGSGKVKENQRVNIKFSNFPYMEYGMVEGKISSISLAPAENYYKVKVDLTNGLTTNYGTVLPFSQEMMGTAEIITDDLSVFLRIMNPVKSMLKEKI